ncbi:MAG: hypothetical protein EOO48_10130, partial [Flavobacterium sp.]
MINPSAPGWIDKFFLMQKTAQNTEPISAGAFYKKVRETGFIYGHIVGLDAVASTDSFGWVSDELSKVALLNSLYGMYCATTGDVNEKKFIVKTVSFYNAMHPEGLNFFRKVFAKGTASQTLEGMINERVQTNQDIVSKNFSHFVTNALLFIDVLAFQHYLQNGTISDKYPKKVEETILSIISLALKTKSVKSQHDDLLIKLLEASVRYSKFSKAGVQNIEALKLENFTSDLEKFYLIDLAGMTLWSDGKIENDEAFFIYKLGELMHVDDDFIGDSISSVNRFITTYKAEIPYFSNPNPVKNFYDHITQSVVVLIRRNKKRLLKEISQSGELMVLLANSTRRDLDAKEKKKVKSQLLDICKSIPAMTIFLLPGGSLLLPILIKF